MKSSLPVLLIVISLAGISNSFAQDTTATFTLSGSIDTYARTALGTENAAIGGYAPSTAFSNLKGFGLGMANLIASYSGEKSGFVADLVFGPRGKDAVFHPVSYTNQRIINQMYAYYKLSDKVTFNLGQFNTFLGYEVISPAINFNYSTSYLFSYGPFSHTGLRADFNLGGGIVAKLAVMNPTDIVEFNAVNTYTLGGQLGYTNDAGGVWLNVLYGDQDGTLDEDDFDGTLDTSTGSLFQIDLTSGWNLGEKFYLGINTSLQSMASGEQFTAGGDIEDIDADATSFFGVALYPRLTISDAFGLGLRAEYFSVQKGHLEIFGLDDEGNGSVTALTLSANYKVGALTLIPEARIDMTSEDSFVSKDGDAKKSMTSLTLAAVYKF
ncbi:outer membrane beta-barrel protein [Chryseosolibacter indicus]|uniref:Outer membrane beta-barrel protein n=1 Tax=Chryseosolibacter indicus TaxID=2782351 RepID=A0ABS5W0W4_9BACT|nr:outer membrane beta-barrel protein [Chryseosolibacter indicus]MBT1705916.1 outer membrane beta-barrel protein [Chryseosolibacter indicus]